MSDDVIEPSVDEAPVVSEYCLKRRAVATLRVVKDGEALTAPCTGMLSGGSGGIRLPDDPWLKLSFGPASVMFKGEYAKALMKCLNESGVGYEELC